MSEIKEVFEENSISDEQMLRYINDAIKAIAVGGQKLQNRQQVAYKSKFNRPRCPQKRVGVKS